MAADLAGRWPPVYSAEQLQAVIRELATSREFEARFWDLRKPRTGEVYQGDIIKLSADVPVLDETAEIAANGSVDHWLVLGNTCDFSRNLAEVPWTQIAPMTAFGVDILETALAEHRAYKHSRQFYVPPWPGGDREHRFADFTCPVTVDKRALAAEDAPGQVVARLQYPAWALLHSCLIRFLARDDGRHEAA